MIKRQVPDRIFLCSIIFLLLAFSVFDNDYRRMGLVSFDGPVASVCRLMLGSLTFLALLDTVINDLLPKKYSVSISLQVRQLIWMFIGCTLAGLAYVNFKLGADFWGGLWLTLFSIRCVSIAFLDLRYELLKMKEQKSCAMFSD